MPLSKKPVPVSSRIVSPEPVLLSILDSAALLGISPTTIIAMLKRGVLPKVHIGKRVMIARADLDNLIAGNRTFDDKKIA